MSELEKRLSEADEQIHQLVTHGPVNPIFTEAELIARQSRLLAKALRKLRHPTRSDHLRSFIDE